MTHQRTRTAEPSGIYQRPGSAAVVWSVGLGGDVIERSPDYLAAVTPTPIEIAGYECIGRGWPRRSEDAALAVGWGSQGDG